MLKIIIWSIVFACWLIRLILALISRKAIDKYTFYLAVIAILFFLVAELSKSILEYISF